MYEIKVDKAETLCPECGKLLRGIRVRQSGVVSDNVFEAILADYRGRYPRLSVDADEWLLVEECQTNHTAALPATSPETDRAALAALYHATDGPNWRLNENWVSDAPMGVWHGVKTDANDRVIHLDLGGNGLSGWIPRELGSLANLTDMRISGNMLSGEIPSELGNLTNLTKMHIFCNMLSGKIPPEFGNLVNLIVLDLMSNQLDGEIPRELGNLAYLEWLDLSSNCLSGEIPCELGNLSKLKVLYLEMNLLGGCVPGILQNQLDMIFSDLGGLPFCPE